MLAGATLLDNVGLLNCGKCSSDEIANIYFHPTLHDLITNVMRLSCEDRAIVSRLFCEK